MLRIRQPPTLWVQLFRTTYPATMALRVDSYDIIPRWPSKQNERYHREKRKSLSRGYRSQLRLYHGARPRVGNRSHHPSRASPRTPPMQITPFSGRTTASPNTQKNTPLHHAPLTHAATKTSKFSHDSTGNFHIPTETFGGAKTKTRRKRRNRGQHLCLLCGSLSSVPIGQRLLKPRENPRGLVRSCLVQDPLQGGYLAGSEEHARPAQPVRFRRHLNTKAYKSIRR